MYKCCSFYYFHSSRHIGSSFCRELSIGEILFFGNLPVPLDAPCSGSRPMNSTMTLGSLVVLSRRFKFTGFTLKHLPLCSLWSSPPIRDARRYGPRIDQVPDSTSQRHKVVRLNLINREDCNPTSSQRRPLPKEFLKDSRVRWFHIFERHLLPSCRDLFYFLVGSLLEQQHGG